MQRLDFARATILMLSISVVVALPTAHASVTLPTTVANVSPALTPIIPATTIVLQPATLQSLSLDQRHGQLDLRQDNLQLQFERLTPDLQGLKPGDVIVSGVTSATPFGMLRKVTAVTKVGSTLQVSTAPAALTDAITQGAVNVQRSLTGSAINSFQALLPGVTRGSSQPQYPFCLSIANVPLVVAATEALPSAPVQVGGQITGSGTICAAITFDLSMQIRGVSLEYPTGRFLLQFQNTGAEMTDVRLTGTGTVTVQESYQLGEFYLQPIVFAIGGVPVVLTPKIVFTLGADGHVTTSVTAGVTQTDTYQAGLQCTNSDCSAAATLPAPSFSPDPLTISAGTTLTGYGTPELDLLLYGVVGPELDLRGYVEADASAHSKKLMTPALSWIVYGGLQVQIGIALDIVGLYHKDYSQNVYSWRAVLAQSQVLAPITSQGQFLASATPLPASPTSTVQPTPMHLTPTATVTPVPTI